MGAVMTWFVLVVVVSVLTYQSEQALIPIGTFLVGVWLSTRWR